MKDISPLFISGEWDDKFYTETDSQSTQDYDTDNLKYMYNKPVILISIDGKIGKASARSIVGFDIGSVIISASQEKLLLKGGKKAAPKVKDTTTNMIQKSTASGVIVGAVGKTVYDKVGDAIDGIKNIFGIDMDEDTLNIFAQIVVKYGIPMAAIGAVLYGGKQLKDYMTGEEEKQTGNTTINNYYNGRTNRNA